WEGDGKENGQLDDILLRLTNDDGRTLSEPSSAQATEIRYNAAGALARRGSESVRLDLLAEMVDEGRQARDFFLKDKNGKERPDEDTARTTILNALQAVAELHRRRPEQKLSVLRPAVERLRGHSDSSVRSEAERTLQVLERS